MKNAIWHSLSLVAGVVLLALGGPWLGQALNQTWEHRTLRPHDDERLVALDVGGMTCVGCAARVRGELAALGGVSAAEVDLRVQKAYVVCARQVPDSALVRAVSRAGPGFMASVAREAP